MRIARCKAPLPSRERGWGEGDLKSKQVFARQLRTHQTEAEHIIWQYVRAKRLKGLKFKRQQLLGNYIVDFICFEASLIIEIDGGQHAECKEYDKQRDDWLQTQGYHVLRFWNNEVFTNIEGVYDSILIYLNAAGY